MKKFNLSLVAILATSTFAMAGGDIAPVEPVVEYVEPATVGGFYLGLGYSGMKADLSTDLLNINKESDTFNQVLLQAGYKFNEYVAVEGRYAIGTDDSDWSGWDHVSLLGIQQNVSADSWGIFVKPMYPVTDSMNIYALLGYGETQFDYAYGSSNFGDTGGFAWGLGADYAFNDSWAIFVDYVDQEDGDLGVFDNGYVSNNIDLDFDTWSVGVTYTF